MKTSVALDEIIAGREHWSHEQPAHHRYVVTVFGLYGRPSGTSIPVAAVVRLMAELDAESSSVRSSISRLKQKGVLISRKTEAGNGYALADELEPHMRAGDERIFSPRSVGIGDTWILVSFSVPESERQKRHKIRTGLARMGFGNVAAGLYIGPSRLQPEAADYISEHQLWDYVELFVCEPSGLGDIQAKVSRWWNLEVLGSEYQAFVDVYQPEIARWQQYLREGQGSPREAFKLYVPMVTHWRRLPYLDPGLPLELLPSNWVGIAARKVFSDLHRLLKPLSAQHFDEVVREVGEAKA